MTSSEQMELEELMSTLGRERYWSRIHKKTRGLRTTDLPAGRYLLRESLGAMSKATQEWRDNTRIAAGRGAHASTFLGEMPSEVVALLGLRSLLDTCTQRKGIAATSFQVGAALREEMQFMLIHKTAPKLWSDLKVRLKRHRDRQHRSIIVRNAMKNVVLPDVGWTRRDEIQVGASIIELAIQSTGMFELVQLDPGKSRHRKKHSVCCTVETLKWLETAHEENEAMFPFYLPTLDLPVEWSSPYDGGYHSNLVLRKPLVKTIDRRSLKFIDKADLSKVYTAVNAIQDTAWELNPVVLEAARFVWEAGIPIAEIPERVDEPVPLKPDTEDEEKLKEWRIECGKRHERVMASRSRRMLHSRIMYMAERFVDKTFYFPHSTDFRGRVYPVPFFLQPQGCSLARGLLRFAAPCVVRTPEAREWFMVHGANCWGFDKVSFRKRTEWVVENHSKIMAVHKDPLDFRWWADADKPWEFLAWCIEYGDASVGRGQLAESFESKIPIAMDGSNNGLQIYSLLLRDEVGAAATNCTPSDMPRDIYQDVADRVMEMLLASTHEFAAPWIEFLGGKLPRAAVKRQVMTLPYGSTFHSCIHYTRDWYEEQRVKRGSTPFERGYKPSAFLARYIWAAIGEYCGKARECMEWIQKIAVDLSRQGEFIHWTAPSGFVVRQEYNTYEDKVVKTTVGEVARKVKYRRDMNEPSPRHHKNGVAPNYVHSLDGAILIDSVNRATARGVRQFAMVHDSYGVPAAEAPVMAECLREAYVEMFKVNQLERLAEEIRSYAPRGVEIADPPEMGTLDVELVRKSVYFFA